MAFEVTWETPYPPQPGYADYRCTFSDFLNLNRDLRDRLFQHRCAIEFGQQPDLPTAVRAAARERANEHMLAVAEVRRTWLRKQAVRDAGEKMFRINRAAILAGSPPCTYCGSPHAPAADHIIPCSQGGTHRRANLTPACTACNTEKGGKTPDQWRAYRESKGRLWPPIHRPAGSVLTEVRQDEPA